MEFSINTVDACLYDKMQWYGYTFYQILIWIKTAAQLHKKWIPDKLCY